MKNVLVIGGAGYFGSLLRSTLVGNGIRCLVFDRLAAPILADSPSMVGDIRRAEDLNRCSEFGPFDVVYHVAAELAHDVKSMQGLWESNVTGTRNIAEWCVRNHCKKLVFTSSNCLWARGYARPILETDTPDPVETYGKSKWEGEKILQQFAGTLHSSILRCPTIISAGRIGLLGILFEFIQENRRVYTVGRGDNRYQFIYGPDLAEACMRVAEEPSTDIYNVGSDRVGSLREVFAEVIQSAGSRSRLVATPKALVLFLMRLAHHLKISPLGPYHYRMIAENFCFDTRKLKDRFGWAPTLSNGEMLSEAYHAYVKSMAEGSNTLKSAHQRSAAMGIIRLVKWLP
jgi:UDP-glucose 4-epimerase